MTLFKSVILISVLFFFSCDKTNRYSRTNGSDKRLIEKNHTIAILPFDNADKNLLKLLELELKKNLIADIKILPSSNYPDFAFYYSRQRYIADSLLKFLNNISRDKFDKIIGVTSKDISTQKGNVKNWGILGLGFCPGRSCVISSFRAGKNKVSNQKYTQRMITLALHELGHTYGLKHCLNKECIMKDAEGKMNLDEGSSYCNRCRKYLFNQGLLK